MTARTKLQWKRCDGRKGMVTTELCRVCASCLDGIVYHIISYQTYIHRNDQQPRPSSLSLTDPGSSSQTKIAVGTLFSSPEVRA
jgi:hypothetical protein